MNAGLPTRSRDEIATAIRTLTPAQWARLKKVAQRYARWPVEPDDLLQEGLVRAMATRNCPANVDVVRFFAEAIRSTADGEVEKVGAQRRPKIAAVPREGDPLDLVSAALDPDPGSEALLVKQEENLRIRTAIFALFKDDPVAQEILEGIMADLTPAEMLHLTGLTQTEYNSKRRLIRRRIERRYPNGWKP